MRKTLILLSLSIVTYQVQAATSPVQIDLSGTLNSASVNTPSLNNLNFNGQFSFDLTAGDFGSRGPSSSGSDNGRMELEFENGAHATASITNQSYPVNQVELSFFDNYSRFDQDGIDERGFTGLFQPNTYDVFFIDGYLSTNQEVGRDLNNGLEYSVVLVFEQGQFGFDTVEDIFTTNPNLPNSPYNPAVSVAPLFIGFEFNQMDNGTNLLHGAGLVTDYNVSAVPVPATFWLFGSAYMGLIVRKRS